MKRQFREPDAATKTKMSAKKAGVNNPMHNKSHSEETKRLISDKLKAYWETVPSNNNDNIYNQ